MFSVLWTPRPSLFVLLIYILENGRGWYLPVALPIILAAGAELLVMTAIHRARRIGKLTKLGCDILALSFLPLIIDIAIARNSKGVYLPQWAWYASVPMFVLGLAVILLSRSVRFTEWLRKKMFI